MSDKRDIELLYELGALRLIDRQWRRFHNTETQNLTEHHFRVTWIALLIAKHEKVTNTDKIMKMAMVHDISESRTGDVDYLARQYVIRDESKGIEDVFKNTALEKEFVDLWHEYEDRECIESKIVKDADNLDIDLELQEQSARGNVLQKKWDEKRNFVGKNKLYTKTAKRLFRQIRKSDPHDWHDLSPSNRVNGGDWKK